jgi:hypothetical protein
MYRLIVSFYDGAVNEWLCNTTKDAYNHLRTLKHVSQWEIKQI